MSVPAAATLPELLAFASERQTADDSAAALAAYERALPLLTRPEHTHDRAQEFDQCVHAATADAALRALLLKSEGC